MNVLFLDMDGVVNSNYLIRKWLSDKFLEMQEAYPHLEYSQLHRLSSEAFYEEFKFNKELVFPELAARLREVIEKCDLKIVWSSSWRQVSPYRESRGKAMEMFDRRGLVGQALVGYTPNFRRFVDNGYHTRMSEIIDFVKDNTLGITFDDRLAAIDDMNLSELENDGIKFFGTEVESGLTEEIKNKMIEFYTK